LFKHGLEFFHGVVGIYLGGGQVGMAELIFHCIEVGPLVEQVGGEGVAEQVRTSF
jgi:hypothetical protein